MRSNILALVLGALIVLLIGPIGCDRHAIALARADAARLTRERDSLVAQALVRQHRQVALTMERDTAQARANELRDSVTALERRRAQRQLTLRQLRTVGALQDTLRAAFPELGDSAWGVTTLPMDDGDSLGLEYLMVPAWFAETFAIDRANAESWREEKDRLLAVDSLRLAVSALEDSVVRLVSANAQSYHAGYQAAIAGYQDLSNRYVAELKKPHIRPRAVIELIAVAGAGVLIAKTIHE
jgi:hypothetical protein